MAAMSTDAQNNTKAQRHKYQGNEYIKDLGLNWMDFQARQYDPQLGRFFGVDPMADAVGQLTLSPYAAMGDMPESIVDPNGDYNKIALLWHICGALHMCQYVESNNMGSVS